MNEKEYKQFIRDIDKLVDLITEDVNLVFTSIYGVPENGSLIAQILSTRFNTDLVKKEHIVSKTLIVDKYNRCMYLWDIFKKRRMKPKLAVLYYDMNSIQVPYLYVHKLKKT